MPRYLITYDIKDADRDTYRDIDTTLENELKAERILRSEWIVKSKEPTASGVLLIIRTLLDRRKFCRDSFKILVLGIDGILNAAEHPPSLGVVTKLQSLQDFTKRR